MKINFNVTGQERKDFVNAIGEIMGITPVYAGAGGNVINEERYRFSYVIMNITVSKDGEVVWDERTDNDTIKKVFDGLAERGYVHEEFAFETETEDGDSETTETHDLEDVTISYEVPFENSGADFTSKKDNLVKLIESKATIIKAALGENCRGDLPIEFTEDGTVKFDWFKGGFEREVLNAWEHFLCAAVKFAKKSQRITAKDSGELSDNPKFDFRVFLVRMGMSGSEYKDARKILLRNLPGNSAFKNDESAAKWKAKHQKGGGE